MKTITIAMAGLFGMAAACGGDDDGGDPVELGVVAPLDGELAFFGRAFPDAISLAMTEINDAGGVAGGRSLIQVTENDQTNPDVAVSAYQKLLDRDVPVIFGPAFSDAVLAVEDLIRGGQTLTIGFSTTSPALTELDDDGYFIRTVPSDAVQSVVLADLIAAEAPDQPLCAVYRDDSYGSALADEVIAHLPDGADVTEAPYDPEDADLSAVLDPCDDLIGGEAALLFVTLQADGSFLIDDAGERGWTTDRHTVFLTDGAKDQEIVNQLVHPELVEGAFGTTSSGPDPSTPEGERLTAFRERFEDRFGRAPEIYMEHVYDAVYVAAMAIEIAGSTEDHAAIRDALGSICEGAGVEAGDWSSIAEAIDADGAVDYTGASGAVCFDADSGDVLSPYYIGVWTVMDGTIVDERVECVGC